MFLSSTQQPGLSGVPRKGTALPLPEKAGEVWALDTVLLTLAKCRPRIERIMAPRPPNYSQDRLQRERAKAAKAKEKAERRAEETARRKAERAKPTKDGAS